MGFEGLALPDLLTQFDQNPVAVFGMQEKDQFIVGATFGGFVQNTVPLSFHPFHRSKNVGHLEGDMVHAFAAFLNVFGNRTFRMGRLKQFDFGVAELEKRDIDVLALDLLLLVGLLIKNGRKKGIALGEVLDGDADVFDFHFDSNL